MKKVIPILILLILSKVSSAQGLTLEVFGSGLTVPTLSYDHTFLLYRTSSNQSGLGLRLKAGAGYMRFQSEDAFARKFGLSLPFGKGLQIEAGIDFCLLNRYGTYVIDYTERFYYPFVGWRFGKGALKGLVSVGPFFSPTKDKGAFVGYPPFWFNLGITYQFKEPF